MECYGQNCLASKDKFVTVPNKLSGNIQSTTVITVAKTYLFMLNSVVQWVGVEPVRVKGLNGLQKGL